VKRKIARRANLPQGDGQSVAERKPRKKAAEQVQASWSNRDPCNTRLLTQTYSETPATCDSARFNGTRELWNLTNFSRASIRGNRITVTVHSIGSPRLRGIISQATQAQIEALRTGKPLTRAMVEFEW
jgi:hypothetical protein